jgi:hypothetical protein
VSRGFGNSLFRGKGSHEKVIFICKLLYFNCYHDYFFAWLSKLERRRTKAKRAAFGKCFYSLDNADDALVLNFEFDFNREKDLESLIAMIKDETVWGNKYLLARCLGGIEELWEELKEATPNPFTFYSIASDRLFYKFKKASTEKRRWALRDAFALFHDWVHGEGFHGYEVGKRLDLVALLKFEEKVLVAQSVHRILKEMDRQLMMPLV